MLFLGQFGTAAIYRVISEGTVLSTVTNCKLGTIGLDLRGVCAQSRTTDRFEGSGKSLLCPLHVCVCVFHGRVEEEHVVLRVYL